MIDCMALLKHLPEIMMTTAILALVVGIQCLIERAFPKKRIAKNKLQ